MFFWIPASAGMTIIVKGFMTHYTSNKGLTKKELPKSVVAYRKALQKYVVWA